MNLFKWDICKMHPMSIRLVNIVILVSVIYCDHPRMAHSINTCCADHGALTHFDPTHDECFIGLINFQAVI